MAHIAISRPVVRAFVGVALVVAGLAVLRPWTVRPLQTKAPPAFDAAAYVEQVWPRILAEAARSAVDVVAARRAAASDAGAAPQALRPLFVRVTGTLTGIDRQSRVGLARVRVSGETTASIAIQVGPVLRGTALRDAAGFIRFTDFANQSDFAAISNALHDRVRREVIAADSLDSLVGRRVTILGATALPADALAGVVIDIVPLEILVVGVVR